MIVEDVDAVEIAAAAEEGLLAVVMLAGIELEGEIVVDPAGEGAGGLADVALAIVAHSHGEELHHLAGEILVRGAFHVLRRVEVGEHGRIARDVDEKLAEAAGRTAMEQRELLLHLAIVADLLLAGCEMAVPEQRHLLLQRPVGRDHAVGPPMREATGLEHGGAQPIEEAIDHRLQAALACRLDAHAHRLAGLLRALGRGHAAHREVAQARVPDVGALERSEVVVRNRVIIDQGGDSRLWAHGREPSDIFGRAAEAGALQQMRGAIEAPVGGCNRG